MQSARGGIYSGHDDNEALEDETIYPNAGIHRVPIMSLPKSLSRASKSQSGIQLSDSAMVPGIMCHLVLRSPISDQPSASELTLISGLLPELIEQLLFDTDVDLKE